VSRCRDFDSRPRLARIEDYFGDNPRRTAAAEGPAGPGPPLGGERVDELTTTSGAPRLTWASAPPPTHPTWYAADLLSSSMTGGKSSLPTATWLRPPRSPRTSGAYVDPSEAVATFGVIATARPGVTAET